MKLPAFSCRQLKPRIDFLAPQECQFASAGMYEKHVECSANTPVCPLWSRVTERQKKPKFCETLARIGSRPVVLRMAQGAGRINRTFPFQVSFFDTSTRKSCRCCGWLRQGPIWLYRQSSCVGMLCFTRESAFSWLCIKRLAAERCGRDIGVRWPHDPYPFAGIRTRCLGIRDNLFASDTRICGRYATGK